ncbi:MAG: LPS-assembly protein LptD, partial [Terriglobia bacterium]
MKHRSALATGLAVLSAALVLPLLLRAQEPAAPPAGADLVEIVADQQRKTGDLYVLTGNVEIRYRGMVLTADRVTYDEKTRTVEARGNVVFEQGDDRVEAREARYNLATESGEFFQVEGTVGAPPRPSRDFLVTTNPYYFTAERVDRRGDGSYLVRKGWVTNCQPGRPKWRLKTAQATIRPGQDARLKRATLIIRGVPILYSPLWVQTLAEEPRQSGFLAPAFGNDSRRGTSFGTAYFWAINPHADLQAGGQFFNQGGWTYDLTFRARPAEGTVMEVQYFQAIADKLERTVRRKRNIGIDQSGQFGSVLVVSELPQGFRGVLDMSFLSSFRFRQGFAETFNEAVSSEVRADGFLSNNPGTFYFNTFFSRYQNFFRARPEESVTLLEAPAVSVGTRPRLVPWFEEQPIYFSLDAEAAGMRRDEPRFQTPELVQRYSLYPRVTVPLRLGRYFGLTPTFGVRASRYGARVVDDSSQPGGKRVLNRPLRRITEEVSVDLRFPSLGRLFERGEHRYKHVIEPEVRYRYVNGVRSFEQILRFDQQDTLTDTHEVEYAITQRLFRRERDKPGHARELVSWRVSQKYYLDPDFRGALRPGARNVFAALYSLTPFAFADQPRRFSPISSTVRVTPRGRFDTDFRLDYDSKKSKVVNTRLTTGLRLTRLMRFRLTHFTTRNDTVLQPRSNQVRLLAAYGRLNRPGVNGAFSIVWDLKRDFLPSQVAQVSYN